MVNAKGKGGNEKGVAEEAWGRLEWHLGRGKEEESSMGREGVGRRLGG